jgi:hypothetical protein
LTRDREQERTGPKASVGFALRSLFDSVRRLKTAEQKAAQLPHRGREQVVRQRTMLVNARCGGIWRNLEGQHSRDSADHCHGDCDDGGRPRGVPLGPRVRRLAGVGPAAEFNRRENPAGTVGRSDGTEGNLPLHWDIDPARMMRPRFADFIRASSPSGLREQAGHMTASDFCAARYIFSCQAGAIHT